MLEIFIGCGGFFKRISDCKVNMLGVRSDHAAIMILFRLTAIKFNNDRDDITIIDCLYFLPVENRNIVAVIFKFDSR